MLDVKNDDLLQAGKVEALQYVDQFAGDGDAGRQRWLHRLIREKEIIDLADWPTDRPNCVIQPITNGRGRAFEFQKESPRKSIVFSASSGLHYGLFMNSKKG